MNKVVVSGLEVPEIWDQENWKGRVAHIKDSVVELFKFIDPDHDYNLGYVKHLNQRLNAARPIVEITLDSDRHGRGIRKCLAGFLLEGEEIISGIHERSQHLAFIDSRNKSKNRYSQSDRQSYSV